MGKMGFLNFSKKKNLFCQNVEIDIDPPINVNKINVKREKSP